MKKSYTGILADTPRAVLTGVILSAMISSVCILLFALIITLMSLTSAAAFPLSSLALGIGCFFGSRYTAKRLQKKGYLCGLLNGSCIFLIATMVALIINPSHFTWMSIIRFAVILLCAMIGGIGGVNGKKDKMLVK